MKPVRTPKPTQQPQAASPQGPAPEPDVALGSGVSGTRRASAELAFRTARVEALQASLADGSVPRDRQLIAARLVEALMQPSSLR